MSLRRSALPFLLAGLLSDSTQAALQPGGLRCEAAVDPLGVDEAHPELSWILTADRRGARQTSWCVLVSTNLQNLARNQGDVWDSGRVNSDETLHQAYQGPPVGPGERVFWKVRVWDDTGAASAWSTNATWTTGLPHPTDWQARWITAPFTGTNGLPVFRRAFNLAGPVERALVHVSGLGHYELSLDGRPVGDRFLDPAWSGYEKTVFYATYDVTEALQQSGPHAFGVMLGKGFYRTRGDRRIHGVDADRPLKLILQADFRFADGRRQRLVSDTSWKTAEGPITHSAILGGEDHDARRLAADWNRPGFADTEWSSAQECPTPGGRLTGAVAPPMRRMDVFAATQIDEPAPGVFVYDFGQNAAAIPRLVVRGRAGQTFRLTPAEQRHGMAPRRNDGRGLVNPAGVGSPNYFEYTLRGDARESWEPQFTYSGFQYLQLEGAVPAGRPNPRGFPEVLELSSVRVGSAAAETGEFECSNTLFNQIDRNITWAVRANLAHVLTDCPHREKLGWLEVSYLMGPSIAGRHDVARFYRKIILDCMDAQGADGRVPTVAPAFPTFSGGFAYTPEWGAAAVVNPWLMFEWFADRRTLERAYPMMRAFVDQLERTSTGLVPVPGLGDWYDYGHGQPAGASRFTPPELTAMATFQRCAAIVAASAHILGRTDDASRFGELASNVARTFNERWFRAPDQYQNSGSPQTANSMAITLGITPPNQLPSVLGAVVRDLRQRGNQQTAGDIGYWYLLQALARNGRSDVIHDLTIRTNLGSYGYIVRNGWTAMPEAWDANTGASMNHCMLGHIQEWFLGWVAGIGPDPDPEAAGFRRFLVQPHPVGDLSWARGRLESPRGTIASRWTRDGGRFTLELTVPPGTVARVSLPALAGAVLTEGGRALVQLPEVRWLGQGDGVARLEVPGGQYRFEVTETK